MWCGIGLVNKVIYKSVTQNKNKMKQKKFLQNVEIHETDTEKGYKAVYSNGLDFEPLFFPIKNGHTVINIPTIIHTPLTIGEIEDMGATIM